MEISSDSESSYSNKNVSSSSKKKGKGKGKMNAGDLQGLKIGNKNDKKIGIKNDKKIGIKKDDDVEVEDPQVGKDFGKVDCTTGIVNWSFTLGPWEAILLKAMIMLFLAGCLVFLVMKLIKEGRLLTGKDMVVKKA